MNKKTTSFLAFVLTSLLPLGASAQTKMVFAPQTGKATQKADAENKMWTYTGFNVEAGTKEDGSKTGGLVDFNLQPFECDTVSSDNGLSPYSGQTHQTFYLLTYRH